MPTSRRRVLAAVAAGASLAGCTGADDPGADATQTTTDSPAMDSPTTTDTPSPTDASGAATVRVRSQSEHGDILVGSEGITLYMFEPDEQGASTCYDDCAEAWPPLTVEEDDEDAIEAGPDVTADLGTTERDDGSLQVTASGWPLYYFAPDEEPGDATGQELGNAWFVLRPDGTPLRPTVSVREHEQIGEILTDARGMTLYMFDLDEQGPSTCYDDCAEAWPPLTVEDEGAIVDSVVARADLGTTERDDGSLQVTANEWPLYYFAPDEEPGDATGHGANDVWWVLRSDGTPVKSDGSTETPTETDDGGYGYDLVGPD